MHYVGGCKANVERHNTVTRLEEVPRVSYSRPRVGMAGMELLCALLINRFAATCYVLVEAPGWQFNRLLLPRELDPVLVRGSS